MLIYKIHTGRNFMRDILSILTLTPFLSTAVLATQTPTFSEAPQDVKVEIAKRLSIPDLKSFGAVSKDFNASMKASLSDLALHILASELTADNIVLLRQVGKLSVLIEGANDASLNRISQLTNLKVLHVSKGQFTPAGLAKLKGLTNLERLELSKTNIDDAGLAELKEIKSLKHLRLESRPSERIITDAGLEHLKGLTNLKTLWLVNTKVTPEGVEKLQKALPNTQIAFFE